LAVDVKAGSFDWGLEGDLVAACATCLTGVFFEGVFTAGVALLADAFPAAVLAGVDFLGAVLAFGVAFLPFSASPASSAFYLAVLFSPTCFFSVAFLACLPFFSCLASFFIFSFFSNWTNFLTNSFFFFSSSSSFLVSAAFFF